jgi:hypothetical protein
MGLGVKPTPATTPQPAVPQVPSRLAVVVSPTSSAPEQAPQVNQTTQTAPVAERKPSKYVRKLSPAPPSVVVYRTTSTSYKHFLRSGAIWRRNELNGR